MNVRWVSEYDYPNRRVSLTLVSTPEAEVANEWAGIHKDQSLSDPGGDFDIYVAGEHAVVKIVAALDDEGDIKTPHPDFDRIAIGPLLTYLWPYKRGQGFKPGGPHWLWWTTDDVFTRTPRPWLEAIRDR